MTNKGKWSDDSVKQSSKTTRKWTCFYIIISLSKKHFKSKLNFKFFQYSFSFNPYICLLDLEALLFYFWFRFKAILGKPWFYFSWYFITNFFNHSIIAHDKKNNKRQVSRAHSQIIAIPICYEVYIHFHFQWDQAFCIDFMKYNYYKLEKNFPLNYVYWV